MAKWKYCVLYYEYIEGDRVRIFSEELSDSGDLPLQVFYDSDEIVDIKGKYSQSGEVSEFWFYNRDEEARICLYSAIAELGGKGWELFSIREEPIDVLLTSIIKSQYLFKRSE